MPRLADCLPIFVLTLLCSCGGDSGGDADAPSGRARTVVLISLDTLRPERLGVYGGDPATSPHIDALAGDSVVFEQALAPSPWTLPSHMTMLTGLDPVAHAVHNAGFRLSRHVQTLAESLDDAGFATGAFTDGGFTAASFGFDQGFDVYDDERSSDGPNGMLRVAPRALSWLAKRRVDESVFLFVHSFDAHTPYDTPPADVLQRFRARPVSDGPDDWGLLSLAHMNQQVKTGVAGYARMAQLMNDYDAGVHVADQGVGRILAALRASGRYDDALILVTSDHGESFLDHGLHVGHGLGVTDDELRVPFVLKLPKREGAGARIADLVGLVDVTRTILDAFALPADASTQGESVLGLVRGAPRATTFLLGASQNASNGFLVEDGFKYVTPTGVDPMRIAQRHLGPMTPPDLDPSDDGLVYTQGSGEDAVELRYDVVGDPLGLRDVLPGAEALYDRRADPREQTNIAFTRPDDTRRLRESYQRRFAASQELAAELFDEEAGRNEGLDREQQRLLETLGYLGGHEDGEQIPMRMRSWALTPPERPDTGDLVTAARAAYAVMVRLDAGGAPRADDATVLQGAAEGMTSWAGRNPRYAHRVEWRLVALAECAARHALDLDPSRWMDALRAAAGDAGDGAAASGDAGGR